MMVITLMIQEYRDNIGDKNNLDDNNGGDDYDNKT